MISGKIIKLQFIRHRPPSAPSLVIGPLGLDSPRFPRDVFICNPLFFARFRVRQDVTNRPSLHGISAEMLVALSRPRSARNTPETVVL
jgi:hypothetical protein